MPDSSSAPDVHSEAGEVPPATTLPPRTAGTGGPPRVDGHAWRRFLFIAMPYWRSPQRWVAWGFLAGLIGLMLADTWFAVQLNQQAGELTSALAAKESDRFWHAIHVCLLVLAVAVPVFAFYYYVRDAFSNHWRRWLTQRFLTGYLSKRTYYHLNLRQDIDNPDQRIAEDINSFTGRSLYFLLILLGSLMQLVAFSVVLWQISVPLVLFLAVYAVVGSVGAVWWFGAPLIKLNFWQVRKEADFRFSLMRLRENAESIAFYRGEAQERERIEHRFNAVYQNYGRLIKRQRTLNLFQRGYSQLTIILPSVLLANAVLSGEMEVGRAIQAAGAFTAVLGAVSLIVDNFESLSRFVAGIDRLHALSQVVLAPEEAAPPVVAAEAGIRSRPASRLSLDHLTLLTPQSDRMIVKDLNLTVQDGEGLLISGVSGCGKSSLLRAIAGLWRNGSGTVNQPNATDMFFLPQRPYMQRGTLRSQMIYPSITTTLSDEQLLVILKEVHLPDLAERVGGLDTVLDWEKHLSIGEQQRLSFARVLVQQPRLAILDEATSALDDRNEASLYQRLRDRGITLISIAHRKAVTGFHSHVLRLTGNGAWELRALRGAQTNAVESAAITKPFGPVQVLPRGRRISNTTSGASYR